MEYDRNKRYYNYVFSNGERYTMSPIEAHREYLKEHNMHEASINDCPMVEEYDPPVWTEELLRKAINHHGVSIGGVLAEALLKGEIDWPEEG